MSLTTPASVEPVESADRSADRSGGVAVSTLRAVWVLLAGLIGLTAAATLTIEKIEML